MKTTLLIILLLTSSCGLWSPQEIVLEDSKILKNLYWQASKNFEIIDSKDHHYQDFVEFSESWKKNIGLNQKQVVTDKNKTLTKKFFLSSINLFPRNLKEYLKRNVNAFIIVENLGVSQFIYKAKNNKYIVFLDANLNSFGLNDWYLKREESALNPSKSSIQLKAYLSYNNSNQDTITYLLGQTIALILSDNENLFPKNLEELKDLEDYNFIKASWLLKNNGIQSKWNHYFDEINYISYYGRSTKTVNFDKIYEFYQLLDKTDFINLYATSSPLSDFVESFTIYIHSIILGKPFHIEFSENNVLLDSFGNCLKDTRCLNKKIYIQKLLTTYLK